MTVLVGNSTVNSSIDISFARIGANSTFTMLTANATGIYANSTLVANSIGPYGKTEGSLNVNNATTATSAPNPNAITFNNGGAGAASGSTYTGSATLTVSYNTVGAPSTSGTGASGTWSININGSAASATNASAATNATFATSAGTANTTQALTFASDGTGAAATTTFNGGTARVISYNSVGAPSTSGTNASGTWSININGSAASATNASAATNATTATSATNATTQSTTGSTNFSVGTLVYSANTQGGRTYETHDFNSYPNLYSTMFINPTGSTNVPAGFSGNGYRFIMGAGDTTTRGFDLLGSSAPALWFRAREQGTWNQVVYNSGTWSININGTAGSAPNPNAVTFNNGGAGAASGSTYTGSSTLTVSYNTVGAPSTTGTNASGTWSISINGSAASAPNPNAVTFNNGGAGAASGSTYTGSATLTVSYNTVGAPSTTGTNASGTWSISINGSAASATNASAATNATTATNWGTYGAVPAAGSSGGTASTIPRSDVNGYTYFGYINSSTSNNENPGVSQVIVTNGTDNFYRKSAIANFTTYLSGTASSLTAGAATNASFATNATSATNASYQGPTGTSNDWVTSFQNTPAHYRSFREMSANGPSGTWWFMENMRHSNGSNYWGRQNAWGWEDNANEYYSRNITGGTFGSWVRFLNSSNYNSYAPTLTGTGASGTWSININGSAASATNASAATNATNASNLGGVAAASYAQLSGATFTGTVSVPSGFTIRKQDNANEGGEFYIEKATNSTLAGNIIVDNNTNTLRIFENGGSFRGATLDITGCGSQSALLHSSNYNSYAPTLTGTGASGTWSININGSAASATNASAATNATTATNQSGGTVSATTGSFSSDLSFNSGYGSAAVAYGCRVWIRFVVSAGVPAISNDGNVSTITDNGVGNFVINFTTALVDANYAAVANYSETNSATGGGNDGQASCHTYATGSVRIYCARGDGSANDPARCSLIVCR